MPDGRPADPGDEYWSAEFGHQGVDNLVYALAFDLDGALYAGGTFTVAGGVTASSIAHWDGAQWHPLGSGMSGD